MTIKEAIQLLRELCSGVKPRDIFEELQLFEDINRRVTVKYSTYQRLMTLI